MLNFQKSIRSTRPFAILLLLVTLCLVAAAPCAAAPGAAPRANDAAPGGPVWSPQIHWSFTAWMAETVDWIGSVWNASRVTLDPDGVVTSAPSLDTTSQGSTIRGTTWATGTGPATELR